MAKKAVNMETGTITFSFDDGKDPLVFDLSKCPAEMDLPLKLHGASQKIGDSYASAWPCQRRNRIGNGSLPDGKKRISIANFQNVLRVIYIPSVGSHFGTNFNYIYHFSFREKGDLDDNDQITISDAVYGINYIFAGGPAPDPIEVMDVDCNGSNSIGDMVYIINYIFSGGNPPCE